MSFVIAICLYDLGIDSSKKTEESLINTPTSLLLLTEFES